MYAERCFQRERFPFAHWCIICWYFNSMRQLSALSINRLELVEVLSDDVIKYRCLTGVR